jgi:hypothetical protein
MSLVKEGNISYEGFSPVNLSRARFAVNQSKRAADLAIRAIQRFDLPANAILIQRWFGLTPKSNPLHANMLMKVQSNLDQMNQAFTSRPITLVYRPDIVVKHAPADRSQPVTPVMLAGGTAFTGQNVYGYVHHHIAGSGMRVVLGKWFMHDPDPQEATQTIYHEVSHKVLKTKDHIYGQVGCINLAKTNPKDACDNADNYGYFAKAMIAKMG